MTVPGAGDNLPRIDPSNLWSGEPAAKGMGVKAILFDAGNTLVWLDHAYLAELLGEYGVAATSETLTAAEYEAKLLMDELVRAGNGDDRSRGRIYFAEVFRRVGLPEERFEEVATRLWARHEERNLWGRVRERTAETLEELRLRGYRLGVVSNADGRVDALLTEVGLRPHFDFVIESRVVGVEKPDPRIFRMACERLGIEPHEAAYVGDIYEIDVVGARGAGMCGILIDPLMRLGHLDCERISGIHDLTDLFPEAA